MSNDAVVGPNGSAHLDDGHDLSRGRKPLCLPNMRRMKSRCKEYQQKDQLTIAGNGIEMVVVGTKKKEYPGSGSQPPVEQQQRQGQGQHTASSVLLRNPSSEVERHIQVQHEEGAAIIVEQVFLRERQRQTEELDAIMTAMRDASSTRAQSMKRFEREVSDGLRKTRRLRWFSWFLILVLLALVLFEGARCVYRRWMK